MIVRLPRLKTNGQVTTGMWDSFCNALENRLRGLELQSGKGYTIKRSANGGTTLNIDIPQIPQPAKLLPFDILIKNSVSTVTATVVPGLVNGIFPSNMFATFTLDNSSLWYFKASVTTDGTQVTSVTLNVDSSPADIQTPALNAMPEEVDVLFAVYQNGIRFQLLDNNLVLTPSQISHGVGNDYSGVWVAS